MDKKNTDTSTIRYYKGLIRDIQAQLKNALARISDLEKKLKKLAQVSSHAPSNMELFSNDDINRSVSEGTIISSGGGFTSAQIKALVSEWIANGELPIALHDHTNEVSGGDAFGAKGASLQ